MKRALITGITGQDGSYLTELLLDKGYEVHGLIRRASTFNTDRIDHIYEDPHIPDTKLYLHYGDLSVSGQMADLIYNIQPDEIYHLGAQSHVRVSFDMPEYTGDVTGIGTVRLLEAIRKTGVSTKFYQASSSEMYGSAPAPQNEQTPFKPRSPYAAAKLYAYWLARNYREGYDLFACNGILFNHESPRRGETFVTRKITRAVARIKFGLQDKIYLGNLEARRDWGYAPEFVEAMWLMLQQDKPEDFVIGTGESHSVREFCELAFHEAGMDLEWRGSGDEEVGVLAGFNQNASVVNDGILRPKLLDNPALSTKTFRKSGTSFGVAAGANTVERVLINNVQVPSVGATLVAVDPRYFRPTEVEFLRADASKARKKLGWEPNVNFSDLVRIMVSADMKALEEMRQCQDVIRQLMNHTNKA